MAVSADARTIAVGAPGNYRLNSKKGYVKVYRTISDDGRNRVQLGQTIYGDAPGDQFGQSVDITADGNTLVIGSSGHWEDNDRPGYMRVFSLEVDDDLGTYAWKQIGADIVGEANGDEFGFSVSISEDGKTIAVGARSAAGKNGVGSGYARVYGMKNFESDWIQIGDNIEGEVAYDYTGESVSLSADGNMVAIGSPYSNNNGDASGHVKVYQVDGSGSIWEQLGQTLYGKNGLDCSGSTVDLSPDGNTLAFGSPGYYENADRPGYVSVFSLMVSNDNIGTRSWKQMSADIIGDANGDGFGNSVSLSNDGKMIAVGAWGYDEEYRVDSGHVRVYRTDESQSDWIQISKDIVGKVAYDCSGYLVSLSADGNRVAIGSPLNDDNGNESGYVREYQLE